MQRRSLVLFLLCLEAVGILLAQKGADPSQRYFRLICLVRLKGSGQGNDAVVPEYVAEGTAIAQAAQSAALTASGAGTKQQSESPGAKPIAVAPPPGQQPTSTAAPMASRPGILGWSMLKTDAGNMAIIQVVAADRHAFDSILADKRNDIRVYEIGVDKPETIQAELQKYKKDFDLAHFRVVVR